MCHNCVVIWDTRITFHHGRTNKQEDIHDFYHDTKGENDVLNNMCLRVIEGSFLLKDFNTMDERVQRRSFVFSVGDDTVARVS